MADVLACQFSTSNLTQGCQKIAVATWTFYHRLESNRSSTEILCAASHAIQRCLMVVHTARISSNPGRTKARRGFWAPARHGTHNTVDGPGLPIEPGRLPFPKP